MRCWVAPHPPNRTALSAPLGAHGAAKRASMTVRSGPGTCGSPRVCSRAAAMDVPLPSHFQKSRPMSRACFRTDQWFIAAFDPLSRVHAPNPLEAGVYPPMDG